MTGRSGESRRDSAEELPARRPGACAGRSPAASKPSPSSRRGGLHARAHAMASKPRSPRPSASVSARSDVVVDDEDRAAVERSANRQASFAGTGSPGRAVVAQRDAELRRLLEALRRAHGCVPSTPRVRRHEERLARRRGRRRGCTSARHHRRARHRSERRDARAELLPSGPSPSGRASGVTAARRRRMRKRYRASDSRSSSVSRRSSACRSDVGIVEHAHRADGEARSSGRPAAFAAARSSSSRGPPRASTRAARRRRRVGWYAGRNPSATAG